MKKIKSMDALHPPKAAKYSLTTPAMYETIESHQEHYRKPYSIQNKTLFN
jgi:hypothetical protein